MKNNNMRKLIVWAAVSLMACKNGMQEKYSKSNEENITTAIVAASVSNNEAKRKEYEVVPAVANTHIKKPVGVYCFLVPYGGQNILCTIAFYPNTFRLQEQYSTKDSTVITEGTWAPSGESIWLYKDQVAYGRYNWKGDTLQYYNPEIHRAISLQKQTPANRNPLWKAKNNSSTVLYGVGTDIPWNIEISNADSITFSHTQSEVVLKTKLQNAIRNRDSTVYNSPSDSLQIITYPMFCSDGKNNYVYTSKIKVNYKGALYKGCGFNF